MVDITRVITGKARSSFMFCTKLEQRGKKIMEDTPKTVKTSILIPKKDKRTVAKIKKAIDAAAVKKFGKARFKMGKDGYPLRDIDEERSDDTLPDSMGDAPKDHYYFNATGYKLPGLIDGEGDEVDPGDLETREELLVSGYYFRFSVTFKAYSNESDGVRAVLNNIMFKEEGERLDGGVNAGDEAWDEDDEDDKPPKRKGRNSGPDIEEQIEELEEELEEAEEEGDRKEARRIKKEIRSLKAELDD